MTKTIYYVAASADGFIADAQGKLDWLLAFEKAEGVAAHYESFLASVGALAMGAATYDFVRNQDVDWPYAGLPTWIFAHERRPLIRGAGVEVQFTQSDVVSVHAQLVAAAAGKNVWLVGGGNLVAQFAEHGLVDEVHLCLVPIILGSGVPLLPVRPAQSLVLQELTPLGSGLVGLRYQVHSVR